MIDMERKWAEGVCANNGVVSDLLADDFQGTNTHGGRYTKEDELRDEKGPRSARGCALDDAKVRFFGENVAIIYGSEHAIGKDKRIPTRRFARSDRYLVEAQWQVADRRRAGQQNRLQVADCK